MTEDAQSTPRAGLPDRHALAAAFEAHFGEVSYVWDALFLDLLLLLRRACLDDMDSLLIISVLGMAEKQRQHVRTAPGTGEAEQAAASQPRITPARLSEMTGIPVDTVRQKLGVLEQAGLVTCESDGHASLARASSGRVSIEERLVQVRRMQIDGASAFAALLVRKASRPDDAPA
jgi:predicted transcriptional regulator